MKVCKKSSSMIWKLFTYKVQITHRSSVTVIEQWLEFANDVVDRIDNILDAMKAWSSDEAHFHLVGYVNK